MQYTEAAHPCVGAKRRWTIWRRKLLLVMLLAGASQLAMAHYLLLGVPGGQVPVHAHFPGLCPGSRQQLCPAEGSLRPGTDVRPNETRDGWTLVHYDHDGQLHQGWVEATRVRYLANGIHVRQSWSLVLKRLARAFQEKVTENQFWSPAGRMPTDAEGTEMSKVAGWPIEEGPWRILPASVHGHQVNVVAVSEGGSCSAMDTQVWSRNLTRMLGPRETREEERRYPFYSNRLKQWLPQIWSGPVAIDGQAYRVDVNYSKGTAYVLSRFGAGYEPLQTLFDVPVLKKHPKLIYCASFGECDQILSGDVRRLLVHASFPQLVRFQKIFHWNKKVVADLGNAEVAEGGPIFHLSVEQEMYVSTQGCGHVEIRQSPLIQREGGPRYRGSIASKKTFDQFTHASSNLLAWPSSGTFWSSRVEFLRVDGRLFVEQLDGVPAQLPGSATYWRVENDGQLKKVAEFSPIFRRLTVPLAIATPTRGSPLSKGITRQSDHSSSTL